MDEQDQLGYPQGLFADNQLTFNLDPLGSATQYLDEEGPFDIRPYEIVKQAVSGYISGFSTFPVGEVSNNRIEQLARQGGHLAGFLGLLFPKKMIQSAGRTALAKHGMSSAASSVAQFRSFPLFAADLVTKKLHNASAMKSAMGYLDNTGRLATRAFVEEGLHLGIASATSAWSDGFQAMALQGLQGGLLGAGSSALANVPFLKSRDTTTNILRGISSGILDMAPTYFMGGDSIDMAYSALLGSYFGYRQPSAAMSRAQRFYFVEHDQAQRGNKGYFYGKDSGFLKLPEPVKEEVLKLSELDRETEVGQAIKDINQRITGDIPVPLPSEKGESARQRIYDAINLREKYNTGFLPQRKIVDFSEGLISEGTNPKIKTWNSLDVATLVETVGQEAKQERNMPWADFKKKVADVVRLATDEEVSDDRLNTLREYHLNKTQALEIPTFGYDSRGSLVPFNERRRDFKNDPVDVEETANYVHLIQRENGMLNGLPDNAGHFVINGYLDENYLPADTYKIPYGDLLDLNRLVPDKTATMTVTGLDGVETQVPFYDEGGNARFYIAHGENAKNKYHGLLYNLGAGVREELDRIKKSFDSMPKEKGADGKYVDRDFYKTISKLEKAFSYSIGNGDNNYIDGPFPTDREYARQFVSNVRYWEQMNKGVGLERLFADDNFLGNVSDFNKRLQPLFNNFYRVGKEVIDRPLRYMISNDFNDYVTLETSGKKIGAEVTDGSTIVSEELFSRLMSFSNLTEKDGSSLKPFVVSNDGVNGLLIGKMAFHKADAVTSAAMAKSGIDIIFHNTSAKQKGARKAHSYRIDDGLLKITGDDGLYRDVTDKDGYMMGVDDIMMDLNKGDSSGSSQKLIKQMSSVIASEQLQYALGGSRYGNLDAGNERRRKLVDQVMQKGLRGDGTSEALNEYISTPTTEKINALFDGGDNAPINRVNKLILYNQAFSKGNEDLRDRLTSYLAEAEKKRGIDEDEVSYASLDGDERADALLRRVSASGGPADIIFEALTSGKYSTQAVSMSSVLKRKTAALYSNWLIESISMPMQDSAFKAIFKPITGGIARDILYDGERIRFGSDDNRNQKEKEVFRPNLTDKTFILESGFREKIIPGTLRVENAKGAVKFVRENRTIQDMFNDMTTTTDVAYRDALRKDLSVLAARVPVADVSGIQDLVLAGFSSTKGFGIILHETTLKRLGGADLDIDDGFLYFNMPDFYREAIRINRDNQSRFELAEPDRVNIYRRRQDDLLGFSQGATKAEKQLAMFDPTHRMSLAQSVSRGASTLTPQAVNNRVILGTMYTHALSNGGTFDDALNNGYRLRYTARPDNGELLRARSDGAITVGVDVAKYGSVVDTNEMLAIQLDGAFSRIDVIDPTGKIARTIMDENSLVYNEYGEIVFNDKKYGSSKTADTLSLFVHNKNRVAAGWGDEQISFKLSDTTYEKLREVNRAFFGRDKYTGKAYEMSDRIDVARNFPRDADGRIPRGYLHEIATSIASLETNNKAILDYVYDDLSRFESSYNDIAEYINQNSGDQAAKDVPFFFTDGHKASLPTKKLFKLLNDIRPLYEKQDGLEKENNFRLDTRFGRKAIANDQEAYEKLYNLKSNSDHQALKYLPKFRDNETSKRISALARFNDEVNRFVEHDIDEMAAIPVTREFYIASALAPEEAAKLLEVSSYMKGAFAKAYKEASSGVKRDKRGESNRKRIERSGQRYAKDVFMGLYQRFFSGYQQGQSVDSTAPEIFKGGVDAFVEAINMQPGRRGSQEAMVTIDGVKDFFDSLLISAHGSETVLDNLRKKAAEEKTPFIEPSIDGSLNALRTQSKTIGFEVAGPAVVQEWIGQYDRLFGNVVTGRFKDNTRELMQGSTIRTVTQQRNASIERAEKVIYPEIDVVVGDDVAKVRDSILAKLKSYSNYGQDPNDLVYVMRAMYGKAQPSDFTFDELRGVDNMLSGFKSGNTLISWLTRKGGFKILENAKNLSEIDGRKWNAYNTIQFAQTQSDQTKIDDIRFVNKYKHEGSKRLLTNIKNADGTWETKYVSATTKVPESWFDRLIDLNGTTKETLSNSAFEKITGDIAESLAPFLKGGFISRDLNVDHQDELWKIAVHEMQAQGALREINNNTLDRDDLKKFAQHSERFIKNKDAAVKDLAEKFGVDTKGLDRNQIEKSISERIYKVNQDGVQRDMTLNEVTNETIFRLKSVMDKIYNEHINGDIWASKYLAPYVTRSGEIKMREWTDSLETMFQLSLPKSPDQHIPYDIGRLFTMENEILVESKRLMRSGGMAFPKSLQSVKDLGSFDYNLSNVLETVFAVEARADNIAEAISLADTIRRGVKKFDNINHEELEKLNALADYLYTPLSKRDMRKVVNKQEYYSQFEQDLLMASDKNMTKQLYTKRRLRHEKRLMATEYVDGMFPHMNHDQRILEADALQRAKEQNTPGLINQYRDEVAQILMRKNNDDSGSDAYADLFLNDNTGNFLSRFSAETFGSALDRGRNWDGYEVTPAILQKYARQLGASSYSNIAHALSRNAIRAFEAGGAMGEHNATWSTWMRLYVRDTMGKPSVFTPEILNDPGLNIKRTPYYWLSDHAMITSQNSINRFLVRANKLNRVTDLDREVFLQDNGRKMTLDDEKAFSNKLLDDLTKISPDGVLTSNQVKVLASLYKGASDLEAKVEMMSLLFHAKSYITNKIGGTSNLVAETGWKPFRQAGKIEYWQGLNPEFKSMKDVNDWVARMGVIENYITHEAGITGNFREGKWKTFFDEATKEIISNPMMKDHRLFEIARNNGITEQSVKLGATFMRSSERDLRTRSFLAGYVKARETYGPMDGLRFDEPFLLDQARKTVSTSQFLYGAAQRPPFSRTSIGKMFSRFKLWGWSSVKLRRTVYQDAKDRGFAVGSREFDRLKRYAMADMMAMSLAGMFPFSLFETALPPPFSWISDIADYFFGEGYEQESAFFGSPLGPLNELTPVFLSKGFALTDTVLRGLVSGEIDTMADYQLSVLFPFGRMGHDVLRSINDPANSPRYLAGIPLREFAGLRDKYVRGQTLDRVAPVLDEAFTAFSGAMTERNAVEYFVEQGYEETEARLALKASLDRGTVSRSLEKTATGRAYVYVPGGDGSEPDTAREKYGSQSLTRGM